MAISENRMMLNTMAVVSFMLDRIGHGAGNGHFMEDGLHYRYYRNGNQIFESEGTVIFDNGQSNQITIPEITDFASPRLLDVFYSTREIITYSNNILKVVGGRTNCGNLGRYEVEIW